MHSGNWNSQSRDNAVLPDEADGQGDAREFILQHPFLFFGCDSNKESIKVIGRVFSATKAIACGGERENAIYVRNPDHC